MTDDEFLKTYYLTSQQRGFTDAIEGRLHQQHFMTDSGGYRAGWKMKDWYLRPDEMQHAGTPYGLELLEGRMPEKLLSYLAASLG